VFGDLDLDLRGLGGRASKLDDFRSGCLAALERERDRILDEMASKKD